MTQLRSRRLEVVAKELSVSLENAHRACDDAEACGRVFVEIAKRYGAPESLEALIPWAVAVGPPPPLILWPSLIKVFLNSPKALIRVRPLNHVLIIFNG